MKIISSVIFVALLGVSIWWFARNVGRIRRNILLGRHEDLTDQKPLRWKTMLKVAFGQTKMFWRPLPAILHFVVYAGFLLINIEVLEIILDGIFGTHRIFMQPLGSLYTFAIGFFEICAVLVLLACVFFLSRRYVQRLARLNSPEMEGWPRNDATLILVVEIVLMAALLIMNAADRHFQELTNMPVSGIIAPWFSSWDASSLHTLERTAWWFHIIGIFAFLNYLPYSKHFHIILAFPNTWYTNFKALGKFANMDSVTNEVKMMMDPASADPNAEPPGSFGAKDVQDLSWKNLMDAYTCTECGRCTSVCPANATGKLLSPRKIMMSTRDRLEDVGKNIDQKGEVHDDGKTLHDYISKEELWACTTCNACAEECPVNINPVDIIYQMRQYLVMEKAEAPNELNIMFNNMENNGAPWQFPPSDRAKWVEDMNDSNTN